MGRYTICLLILVYFNIMGKESVSSKEIFVGTEDETADRNSIFYKIIASIDPNRKPEFTAFEQIQGVELARMFLLANADLIRSTTPTDYETGEKDPLDVAIANMRYIAGYYIDNSKKDSISEHSKRLKPWNDAYAELTKRIF